MTDYTVAAEFTLKDNVSRVLGDVIEKLDQATRVLGEFQERLDKLGGAGVNRLLRALDKLQGARFPTALVDDAARFDAALRGADGQLEAMTKHAAELAAAMKDLRVPTLPATPAPARPGPRGGGGHGGGDPIMAGIEGGAVLEFLGGNYERYSRVDQVYRAMLADSNLRGDSPVMAAIRNQAGGQLDRYKTLKPLEVAQNAAEAYTIGGGSMAEQPAIADMLDRAAQSLILRGKSPEDAQAQAKAIVRGLDVSNQFFSKKTGEFDQGTADTSMTRVLALVNASGGFATGQNFLAFEKSAGLAGQQLSLEGEAKLAHFIDINPSRSGSSLKSFENLFGGRGARMSKKDKAFWTAQGLYDKKTGLLVDNDKLGPDPIGWIAAHLNRFSATDIQDHTQRQNVGSLSAKAQGAQGNLNRGAAAVARSDPNANNANLLNSPVGATIQFEASLERFRSTLGKFEARPGTKILDDLTSGLGKLDDVLEKHPQMADYLLKLTAGIAALAVVRGVASLTGIGDGLGTLGKGLGLFGKGAAAETALEGLGAAAGAGSLFGLAGGIVALGAAVLGLPPILKWVFGDKDQTTSNATNAHGMPYASRPPEAAGAADLATGDAERPESDPARHPAPGGAWQRTRAVAEPDQLHRERHASHAADQHPAGVGWPSARPPHGHLPDPLDEPPALVREQPGLHRGGAAARHAAGDGVRSGSRVQRVRGPPPALILKRPRDLSSHIAGNRLRRLIPCLADRARAAGSDSMPGAK